MDKSNCSICDNAFDGTTLRPRTLPCGHSFCTQCIQSGINKGNGVCLTCSVEHGVNCATDIPICYLFEEFSHMIPTTNSQTRKLDSSKEDGDKDMCPKHKEMPLHLFCKSHGAKTCHTCAVIEHSTTSCLLISLENNIKEKKQSQIAYLHKQKQAIMDTEKDLTMLLKRNVNELSDQQHKKENIEKEVDVLIIKIEKIQQDMIKEEKVQDQIKNAIQGCQKKKTSFENTVKALENARSNQDIIKNHEIASAEILKSQKWEVTLRKELNIREVNQDTYAAVRRGGVLGWFTVLRCSQVLTEGGRTIIPKLSREVIPPSSATMIQEEHLGLTSATTTVFLDISVPGVNLGIMGRVHICVKGDRPWGQQFITLALGTEGPSFKGANFGGRWYNRIILDDYVTEIKGASREALLPTLQKDHHATASRGRLFPCGTVNEVSFQIITKNCDEKYYGHFGDVISGMEVIDKAASSGYNIKDVIIIDCGIVLDY